MMNEHRLWTDAEERGSEQEGLEHAQPPAVSAVDSVPEGNVSGDGGDVVRVLGAKVRELQQTIDRLAQENESLKSSVHEEQMLRIREQATLQRDKSSFEARTKLSLFLDLLAIVDSFDQLVRHGEGSSDGSSLAVGAQAVLGQLNQFLVRNGVHKIEGLEGNLYDSSTSEIARVVVESEAPANTVIRVLRDGYKLGDRLLRPAMVDVSGAPEKEAEIQETAEGTSEG